MSLFLIIILFNLPSSYCPKKFFHILHLLLYVLFCDMVDETSNNISNHLYCFVIQW